MQICIYLFIYFCLNINWAVLTLFGSTLIVNARVMNIWIRPWP